ncbi:MAG: nucleotidyltransferase family protein [Candidatus Omnitrophica bacterium]|nr:nucleotidyltransferase family protein [Candidatus Omnitrophota bacterium]
MIPLPTIHPFLLRWLRRADDTMVPPLRELPDDWAPVLADASEHRLMPLLHRASRIASTRPIPDGIAGELGRLASATAAKNLLFRHELAAILRAANARGMSCAPLRGVALGEQLYGDPALRPTGDLDVLIKPEELPAVRALLGELGYYEVEARAGFALAFDYTLEFFKDRPLSLIVEPHWTIAYPPFVDRLPMPGVWARCRPRTVAGVPTSVLGPEDLLIHLCLHLLHHQHAAPFLWVYELDRLLRVQPVDWPLVCAMAQEAGVAPLLRGVLETVAMTLRTPLPPDALERLARAPATGRQARVAELLARHPNVKGRERIALLVSLRGIRAKLRYVWSFLFPAPAFIRVQYGVASWWQVGRVYVTRAGYLLWGGLTGLVRLLLAARTVNENSGRPSA